MRKALSRPLGSPTGTGRGAIAAAALAVLPACSSLSTPALKHETAEPLGPWRLRANAFFESSRLYPLVASGSSVLGVSQSASAAFQDGILGARGSVGVGPVTDLQLGSFYLLGGGGWRVGTKTRVYKQGNLAVAALLGYGRYSSKGTLSLLNLAGQPVEVAQTLSAYQIDLSFPVSWTIGKNAVYGGLNYYRSGISGSSETSFVSDTTNDLGVNLGFRYAFGSRYDADFEVAAVRLYDPLADSMRFVLYYGVGFGVNF